MKKNAPTAPNKFAIVSALLKNSYYWNNIVDVFYTYFISSKTG